MRLADPEARARLEAHDHGILCTVHAERGVDAVPVAYAVDDDGYVGVPVDLVKPKASLRLQRERNLEADPRATLLAEHWDRGDWSRLWWVRAELRWQRDTPASRAAALAARLAGRYPQYQDQPFARVLVLHIVGVSGWAAAGRLLPAQGEAGAGLGRTSSGDDLDPGRGAAQRRHHLHAQRGPVIDPALAEERERDPVEFGERDGSGGAAVGRPGTGLSGDQASAACRAAMTSPNPSAPGASGSGRGALSRSGKLPGAAGAGLGEQPGRDRVQHVTAGTGRHRPRRHRGALRPC
jgi:Pyridoxamine 5'-phosphate oxidase